MSAPTYYEEQRNLAKVDACYHVQLRISQIVPPSVEDLEKGLNTTLVTGTVLKVFQKKSKDDTVSIGNNIEISVSPTYPENRLEFMPTDPALIIEDFFKAKVIEVFLDKDLSVPCALLTFLQQETETPTITDE
ncbi:MAG: hypothetical protein HQK84_06625 [Nitrospinae bacterium]|nr:hypothetical protein [Nitrospinota bacterium]